MRIETKRATYGEGTLEGNLVAPNGLNGSIRNGGLAILEDGVDVDRLPVNGGLTLSVSEPRVEALHMQDVQAPGRN